MWSDIQFGIIILMMSILIISTIKGINTPLIPPVLSLCFFLFSVIAFKAFQLIYPLVTLLSLHLGCHLSVIAYKYYFYYEAKMNSQLDNNIAKLCSKRKVSQQQLADLYWRVQKNNQYSRNRSFYSISCYCSKTCQVFRSSCRVNIRIR